MSEREEQSALLKHQFDALEDVVAALEVESPEDVEHAGGIAKDIKFYLKSAGEFWDPLVKNAHASWKALTKRKNEFLDPAKKLEAQVKGKISAYYEQERKRQAEDLARRRKETEEAAAKERMSEIEELQAQGQLDEAEHIAEQPLDIPTVAKPEATKVEGLSTQTRWSAEVEDLGALLKFCAKEPRFQYLILPNQKELNKLAVGQKEMFDIPGVKAVPKTITSVRS